jgi:hypothetical protein
VPPDPAADARRGPGVEHIHVDGDAEDTDGAWPEEEDE